jgi:hypothetical protein
MTTQRCVRIIQVGMVLFLLFFARYLGVNKRQHSFGIALGFGTFAFVELALIASWAGNHLSNGSMNLVNMAAYNVALFIWGGYLWAKSPARDAGSILLRPQRWEQGISDIQHPTTANSLIPMFEGMVDRALSRTQPSPLSSEPDPMTARSASASMSSLGIPGLSTGVGSKPAV